MSADDNRRDEDKELEDDGPIEVLDDDDIAVLKTYVCICFTTPFFCFTTLKSLFFDSRAALTRRRSTMLRRR